MMSTWHHRLQEEEEILSDSAVLRQTFMIYGPFFAFIWIVLCYVRKRFPHAYNLRSWVPNLKCNLAQEQYGFLSWTWRVYSVSDEDMLRQCGMDALCLCRAVAYSEKLSWIGILLSVLLLPIYKTAPDTVDTEYITDRVIELTIANVPEGSNRLYAAVVAAYIFFIVAWWLLLRDFHWFQQYRLKFLSEPKPRNYSVYISGIPHKYRSNKALTEYFEKLFTKNSTVQSSVAFHIPHLQHEVKRRQQVVQKLEHCLALKSITGVTPVHREKPMAEPVNSIDTYQGQLCELNTEISNEITRIEESAGDDENNIVDSSSQGSFRSCLEKEGTNDVEVSDLIEREDSIASAESLRSLHSAISAQEEVEQTLTPLKSEDEELGDVGTNSSFTSEGKTDFVRSDITAKAPYGNRKDVDMMDETGEKKNTWSHSKGIRRLTTTALLGSDREGDPLHAGFVSFASLTDTNAAIQVVHSTTPYQMIVHEAPNHQGILWNNVGLGHKAVQFGVLTSFCLSGACCLFYTIPVSFALSLTSVENLMQRWPALEDVIAKHPWLEGLLDQISPLLLSFFNSILPNILKSIASLEGHVGESFLEASLFSKLSAFNIIQTFFVANAAGSITEGLELLWEDPTLIVQFLAVQLPPQSTFYIQLVMIGMTFGIGFECLRVFPLFQVWIRQTFGPRLTPKERTQRWMGLRPLSDPRPFFHARVVATIVLYLMICFVYTVIAPITCYVLAFCFLAMGSAYRNQFFYIYSTNPDSGGQLWLKFVNIALICMAVAQVTLSAYLALKKANVAAGLLVPLVIFQILFHIFIRHRHFKVAERLPTEDSLQLDAEGPSDVLSFCKDKYKQPAMKVKVLEPEQCPPSNSEESIDSDVERREQQEDNSQSESIQSAEIKDEARQESHTADKC